MPCQFDELARYEGVASLFNLPHALACEIMWENDEVPWTETPRARWERVRRWIVKNLRDDQPTTPLGPADPLARPREAKENDLPTTSEGVG